MNIGPFQAAVLIVAALHIARVIFLWRKRKIEVSVALFWVMIWAAIVFVAFDTQTLNALTTAVGIGRTVDLAMYIGILILLYVVFQLNMKVNRLERQLTKLVREISLKK